MERTLGFLLGRFTYVAIVAVLCAAGVGAPVSEDLVLLIAGGLSARGVTEFWPSLLAGYGGVLVGDVLIHQWGKRLGPAAYVHPLVRKVLSVERQEKLRAHFGKHGGWTVVVGRHTPGLRAPIFFLSGASGVPLWKFAVCDALSAAVTVPLVVALGYYFGAHLHELRAKIHHVEWAIAGAVAATVIALWLVRRRRRRSGA